MLAVCLALACMHAVHAARLPLSHRGFLIVSSPTSQQIVYMSLDTPEPVHPTTSVLISDVVQPMGLAVDSRRNRLLVADLGQTALFSYELIQRGNTLSAGQRTVLVNGTAIRWVAVNSVGDIVYSDEGGNAIMLIPGTPPAGMNSSNASVPLQMYNGSALPMVSAPGGVAMDSFFTYWANKVSGTEDGSVIKALSTTSLIAQSATPPVALASNAVKSHGLCFVQDYLLYTQEVASVFAVKSSGGSVNLVTDNLQGPRGCVWDGEGTVYVADYAADAVYAFPSADLTQVQVSKTVDVKGAYGMAVLAATSLATRSILSGLSALAVGLAWLL